LWVTELTCYHKVATALRAMAFQMFHPENHQYVKNFLTAAWLVLQFLFECYSMALFICSATQLGSDRLAAALQHTLPHTTTDHQDI
jgi:hypothetical protein